MVFRQSLRYFLLMFLKGAYLCIAWEITEANSSNKQSKLSVVSGKICETRFPSSRSNSSKKVSEQNVLCHGTEEYCKFVFNRSKFSNFACNDIMVRD